MKGKYMKILRKIIILCIFVVLIVATAFGLGGYNYYNKAVSQISLEDKVTEIRSKENFVKYDDLPKDLVDATIAVEDHRFWEHGSVDFISICRAVFSNMKSRRS
jgi:membrane peptidoglycan carboxypeptidase